MFKQRIAFLFGMLLLAVSAHAQVLAPPDPATVRVRMGRLWMNPTLALTNAGVDTNVFNDADDAGPKRDFTITVTPNSELWLRMGRTWVAGSIREDILWFRKYASERSISNRYGVAWIVPLTRVSFSVGGAWINARERPGFEIDARAHRNERAITGAAQVRALSKTLFGVRGERRRVDFDESATFLGTNLHEELTRTGTTGAFTIRHELTPLTTITVDLADERDRFEGSPLRDSDSRRIDVGVTFDPRALFSGSARIGFRDFEPLAAGVSGFSGTTTMVDLAYVALGSTRFAVQAERDVQYSFDADQPYYLQTGFSASIAQQLFGPIDVEARFAAQRLSYRDRDGGGAAVADRVDRIRDYGGGIGYHFGQAMRVGFNVDQQRRESPLERRQYNGLRYGTSVTYGF